MNRRDKICIILVVMLVVSTLVVLYMYLDTKYRYESLQEYIRQEKIIRYRAFLGDLASALTGIQSGINYYYKHNNTCRIDVAKAYLAYGANLLDASANYVSDVNDKDLGLPKITELHDVVADFSNKLRSRYLTRFNATMNVLLKYNSTIPRIADDLDKLDRMLREVRYKDEISTANIAEWDNTMNRVLSFFYDIMSDLDAI